MIPTSGAVDLLEIRNELGISGSFDLLYSDKRMDCLRGYKYNETAPSTRDILDFRGGFRAEFSLMFEDSQPSSTVTSWYVLPGTYGSIISTDRAFPSGVTIRSILLSDNAGITQFSLQLNSNGLSDAQMAKLCLGFVIIDNSSFNGGFLVSSTGMGGNMTITSEGSFGNPFYTWTWRNTVYQDIFPDGLPQSQAYWGPVQLVVYGKLT